MRIIRSIGAAVAVTLTCASIPAVAEWKPSKPVEFVVSAGPGGGTDQFARLVQSVVQKYQLLPVAVIVTNKGGGAGSEAFVFGKMAGNDPHKLIFSTNLGWLMPLVTRSGYQSQDLTPVAVMAADEFLLWTNAAAPYKTAKDLIEGARTKAGGFRMGGAQAKDTDHILTRQIEKACGVKMTYVPFKSGAEVSVQLAGGHVDANTNNPQENVSQWKAGMVRPLCVFAPQRLAYKEKVASDMSWADIPTCKDAGVPIESFQMPRTVWLPGKVSDEQLKFYVDVLAKVRETPEWKEWLARGSQSDLFVTGDKLLSFIREDETKHRKQFAEDGWLVTE